MIIKPLTALMIVLAGQSNILLQNYEKAKQLYQKVGEKSDGHFEEEKDAKKSALKNSANQKVVRINKVKKLGAQTNLFAPSQKYDRVSFKNLDLALKYKERLLLDFNGVKSVWFGCCKA
jgi:hypothetical protein